MSTSSTRTSAAPAREPGTRSARLEVVPGPGRFLRVGVVVLLAFAVAVLFGLVAFNALIVRTQSTIDDLDVRLAEVREVNQRLLFEIAELESPERIRSVALDQLGMIEPEVVTYLEPIPRELLDSPPADRAGGAG